MSSLKSDEHFSKEGRFVGMGENLTCLESRDGYGQTKEK